MKTLWVITLCLFCLGWVKPVLWIPMILTGILAIIITAIAIASPSSIGVYDKHYKDEGRRIWERKGKR